MDRRILRAIYSGDLRRLKFLIKEGVDVNQQEWDGRAALFWAVAYDRIHMCRFLLDSGAHVNHIHEGGWTPLIYASFRYNIRIIKLLLVRGANVHPINKHGHTALDYALQKGNMYISRILLWRGAKSNRYKMPKKLINIDGLLLLIYRKILPSDLVREIHTKWIS